MEDSCLSKRDSIGSIAFLTLLATMSVSVGRIDSVVSRTLLFCFSLRRLRAFASMAYIWALVYLSSESSISIGFSSESRYTETGYIRDNNVSAGVTVLESECVVLPADDSGSL